MKELELRSFKYFVIKFIIQNKNGIMDIAALYGICLTLQSFLLEKSRNKTYYNEKALEYIQVHMNIEL